MKSVEGPETARPEGEWKPFEVVEAFPSASGAEGVPGQSPESGALSSSRPYDDGTRLFLHQLSQTLTSLRGFLELALLDDSDAQGYRNVIQQSLVQAEALVQLFKSYRRLAEGGTTGLTNEENWE